MVSDGQEFIRAGDIFQFVPSQRFATDGGFGLSTAEDNLRVYFAKNLQDPGSDFVISARLQRPF